MAGWVGGLTASSAPGLSKLLRETLVKWDLQLPAPAPPPAPQWTYSPASGPGPEGSWSVLASLSWVPFPVHLAFLSSPPRLPPILSLSQLDLGFPVSLGGRTIEPVLQSLFLSGHLPGKAPQPGGMGPKSLDKAHIQTSRKQKNLSFKLQASLTHPPSAPLSRQPDLATTRPMCQPRGDPLCQ